MSWLVTVQFFHLHTRLYRSAFKYTNYDGRGTKEFCGHNIGLKGYWGLLKETEMFTFFTPFIINNIAQKIISVFENHIKAYCMCFWLVVPCKKLLQSIRSTTQIWVVICHQYWISVLPSSNIILEETSGGMVKSWLFSQAIVL